MKKASLVLFFLICAIFAINNFALGQEISIEPARPRSDENVFIRTYDEFSDGCVSLQSFEFTQEGNEIYISFVCSFPTGSDAVCPQVMTQCGDTAELGTLEPGTYTVFVEYLTIEHNTDDGTNKHYNYNRSISFEVLPSCSLIVEQENLWSSRWLPIPLTIMIRAGDFEVSQNIRLSFKCESEGFWLLPTITAIPLTRIVLPASGSIYQPVIIWPAGITGNFFDETEYCSVTVENKNGKMCAGEFEYEIFDISGILLYE